MAIKGIVPGATGVFKLNPTAPPGAAFPAGTIYSWTVDDTANITLTNQTTQEVSAALAASPAGGKTSCNLSCTATGGLTR